MKELFSKLGGRRLYTLGAAILLFIIAALVNQFIVSSTSSSYYARLIQNDIYAKERNFKNLAADSQRLLSLVNRTYSFEEVRIIIRGHAHQHDHHQQERNAGKQSVDRRKMICGLVHKNN